MFKNTLSFIVLALLIVTSISNCTTKGNSEANNFNPDKQAFNRKCGPGKRKDFLSYHLKLDNKQKEIFNTTKQALLKEAKPHFDIIRETKAKLITASTGDTANLDDAKSLITIIGKEKIKLKQIKMKFHQQLRDSLNAEQKVKFDMMPRHPFKKRFSRRPHHKSFNGHGPRFNNGFHPAKFDVPGMPPRGKGPHFLKREERLAQILELTEVQKKQFKQERLALIKKKLPIKNKIRENKEELRTLSTQDQVDLSKINSLIEEIGNNKIMLMQTKAEHVNKLRSLLTEEQKIIFDIHTSKKLSKRKRFRKR